MNFFLKNCINTDMKNLFLYFFSVILVFYSCNSEDSKKMQVSGTLKGNPSPQVVYLDVIEAGADAPRTVDTATLPS